MATESEMRKEQPRYRGPPCKADPDTASRWVRSQYSSRGRRAYSRTELHAKLLKGENCMKRFVFVCAFALRPGSRLGIRRKNRDHLHGVVQHH